jgi:N6-L-threonylcarbamoyladenine synthase
MKQKIILGIETSCDETAAAVLLKDEKGITILSNVVASSADLQSKYGGIIPEQAAREQIKSIIPVIDEAIKQSNNLTIDDIDAIAVTQGPGLIGSLLVGVETAKTLSLIWNKPLIPVNHLIGHFYANWIGENTPNFPCLGLLVSGGHSDLVLFTDHSKFKYLGGTRDDAAGECFDKSARLLGLPYPGGPQISKLAKSGDPKKYKLPRPLSDSKDLDFSFSGLKTAVSNLIDKFPKDVIASEAWQSSILPDLCASIEQAIVDSLVKKTVAAAQIHHTEQVIIAGGVAANPKLTAELRAALERLSPPSLLLCPPPSLCTDNGAMIAAAAFFQKETLTPGSLDANPNLSLAY